MNRSPRKYNVELRIRDNNGSRPQGVVTRFLYTDKSGQDWVRVEGEWFPVDDRFENVHAFVFDLPRDLIEEENVLDFDLEREAA
jgi:hypothetical protein